MATTKKYSEGGTVEQSGGLAGMIQDSRRKSAEQGVVRTKAPFKAMQPGLDRIVGAMERKVASQATKNRTTQGATQTSDAGYKKGGRVGEPGRPKKVMRANMGGMMGTPMMNSGGMMGDGPTVNPMMGNSMMGGASYKAGGTVLSSGKTVDSTHSHLMKQGKAMGFR